MNESLRTVLRGHLLEASTEAGRIMQEIGAYATKHAPKTTVRFSGGKTVEEPMEVLVNGATLTVRSRGMKKEDKSAVFNYRKKIAQYAVSKYKDRTFIVVKQGGGNVWPWFTDRYKEGYASAFKIKLTDDEMNSRLMGGGI